MVRAIWKPHSSYSNDNVDIAIKIVLKYDETGRFDSFSEVLLKEFDILVKVHDKMIDDLDTVSKAFGIARGKLPLYLVKSLQCLNVRVMKDDEAVGLVLRYEAGGSLVSHLYPITSVRRPLSLEDKIRILYLISRGVAGLHSQNVVHGDLKPENILLSSLDLTHTLVRVADFGSSEERSALAVTRGVLNNSSLILTTAMKSTPRYAAPEMLPNPNIPGNTAVAKASRKTDVYALCAMIWELLAEKRPFVDVADQNSLCLKVHSHERPLRSDLPKEVPLVLIELIYAGMSGDRHTRPSAIEICTTLGQVYNSMSSGRFNIFFSHPWANKPFLSHVYYLLIQSGYRVWYDESYMGYDLQKSMREGIANSDVVVACISTTYQDSKNCMFELNETLHMTPTKSVIALVTEPMPFNWANDELKTKCQLSTKMFVDLSELATEYDWMAENGPSNATIDQLRKKLATLTKILYELQSFPLFSPLELAANKAKETEAQRAAVLRQEKEASLEKAMSNRLSYQTFADAILSAASGATEANGTPFEALRAWTGNFNAVQKLGEGRYGEVYSCVVPERKFNIAIKKLKSMDNTHSLSSLNVEIRVLSAFKHPNIIKLLGFSAEAVDCLCLVYELGTNGDLCKAFENDQISQQMTWKTRIKIASG